MFDDLNRDNGIPFAVEAPWEFLLPDAAVIPGASGGLDHRLPRVNTVDLGWAVADIRVVPVACDEQSPLAEPATDIKHGTTGDERDNNWIEFEWGVWTSS